MIGRLVIGALLVAAAAPTLAQHAVHNDAQPSQAIEAENVESLPTKPSGSTVGTALRPATPTDRWADRIYPKDQMDEAREAARAEHGASRFFMLTANLAEVQARKAANGYRWDGEAWFGGDIDRITLKSEGEGDAGKQPEDAEIQAVWSHALDGYWNLQAGARADLGRGSNRTYATVGVEGLAPLWFEVEAAAFLSDQGELHGRFNAYYDQRITQRLILQPRIEANLSAQDVPSIHIGAGLVSTEFGVRLRYELAREFAPYVGVSWERQWGATARIARADGEDIPRTSLVAGVRFWF